MRLVTRVSCVVLSVALLSRSSACGTLFYPEQCGQIDGCISPIVVVFDVIGLLFYVIPGLIAPGVDFATDAIYLPDTKYSAAPEVLKDVVGTDGKVNNRKLKAILECEISREPLFDDPRLTCHNGSVEQPAAYGLKPAA